MSEIGDLLGPYRLDEIIGRGGFATVYRATHVGLDIERAVKVLKREYSDDTQIRGLFQREARRGARLSPENVVEVFDAGETDGEAWIASELMPDGTLADALQLGRKFSSEAVRRMGIDLAHALAEAHAQKLLHRDLKPANVFLKPGGGAKLGDFGVAAELSERTHASTMVGTLSYMAPEQDGGSASPKSDVYGLGAVLFEAWTGSRAPALARLEPTWPPGSLTDHRLRNIISAMLSVDGADRPDATDLLAGLTGSESPAQSSDQQASTAGTPPRKPPPPVSTGGSAPGGWRRPLFSALAIVAMVIGIILVGSLTTRDREPSSSSTLVAGVTFTPTPTATQTATPTRTATPRPTATVAPTATSASGTRWIANTGGVGVRARTDCRDSSSGTSPGVPENTRVDLSQRGINRCAGWSRVRASAGGQIRTVWVSNQYLSSAEPTPVPTAAPIRTPTRTPTPSITATPTQTPTIAASGPKPQLTCLASTEGQCLAGLTITDATVTYSRAFWWSGQIDGDWTAVQYSIDGGDPVSKADFYASSVPVGRHFIQVWDPPGGSYSGWSERYYYNVVATTPVIGVFGAARGDTSSRATCEASSNQIRVGFLNGWCVWVNYDSSQSISYALNGGSAQSSAAFGSALSALPAGTHRFAVFDPVGGNYEGWSDWWTITVLP